MKKYILGVLSVLILNSTVLLQVYADVPKEGIISLLNLKKNSKKTGTEAEFSLINTLSLYRKFCISANLFLGTLKTAGIVTLIKAIQKESTSAKEANIYGGMVFLLAHSVYKDFSDVISNWPYLGNKNNKFLSKKIENSQQILKQALEKTIVKVKFFALNTFLFRKFSMSFFSASLLKKFSICTNLFLGILKAIVMAVIVVGALDKIQRKIGYDKEDGINLVFTLLFAHSVCKDLYQAISVWKYRKNEG